MASAHPEGDVDIRERWLRYKATMDRNAPHAVALMLKLHVFQLKILMSAGNPMKFEFFFIDIDADVPPRDIVARLWDAMTFRPDVARRVEQLCRGERIDQTICAELLREAIDAADWPEEFWSPPSQADISLPNLRRTGDALAGLATICCDDLKRLGILTPESAAAVSKEAKFSEARGRELARQLTSQGWTKLHGFLEKEAGNRFLLRVFDSAAQGRWAGPAAFASNLPELPSYVTERDCFKESREKLQESVDREDQVWIDIWGPRAAGKTTAALHLANRAPPGQTALWFSFGEKRAEEIYDSARRVVENCFPKSDLSSNPDSKIFLRESLSGEKTKDFVFFLDDVCDANVLAPFGHVKTAVITSPILVEYHDRTVGVLVNLSLTEKESVAVVENILEEKLSSIEGHEHLIAILRTTHFNALATSVLASYIKSMDKKKRNKNCFQKLKESIEKNAKKKFSTISEGLKKKKKHEYISTEEVKYLNIYAMSKFIIQDLSEELKEAFHSLIVFSRDTPIVSHVFQKINDDEEYLDILFDRSLLGRIGEDYSLHGLMRDVLEDSLNSDEKKKFFEKLVSAYEADGQIDEHDSFYLLYFISTCLNAERRDVANRLMSSADFLLKRFFQTRFTNLFNDFESVMSAEPNDAVDSFRNFFSDPQLWNQGFDKETLLRQAILFQRHQHIDRELRGLVQKEEVELPLFRAESQKLEELRGYKEVSLLASKNRKRNLALQRDGSSVAMQGDEKLLDQNVDEMKTIFNRMLQVLPQVMDQSRNFQEVFEKLPETVFQLLSKRQQESFTARQRSFPIFPHDAISNICSNFSQSEDARNIFAFHKSVLPCRETFEGSSLHQAFQYATANAEAREIFQTFLSCDEAWDYMRESMRNVFQELVFGHFSAPILENLPIDLLSSNTELLLFDPQLSVKRKRSFSEEEVLCVVATNEDRWLLVTRKACLVLGSDLSEVARCSIGGEVRKAAVDPSGNVAALWTKGRSLILFWTAVEEMEEICAIPDGWGVVSVAVTTSAVAALCKAKENKEGEEDVEVEKEEQEEKMEEKGEEEEEDDGEKGEESSRLLFWSIEEREAEQHKLKGKFQDIAFLSKNRMALCGGQKLSIYNWKSRELSSIAEKCDFIKSSPDGSFFAVANRLKIFGRNIPVFQSFKVFDCNLSQMLSSDDYNLGALSDFALSDSNIIAYSSTSRELVLFRKNERLANFPRVQLSPQGGTLGAVFVSELQDFALFLRKGNQYVCRALKDDSKVCFVDRTDWGKKALFLVDENKAAVWEKNGHRLALLWPKERLSEQYFIEEEITDVDSRDPRFVAVGTSRGQILVREGSQWREVARCEGPIADLFLFEDGIAVRLRNETFRIFSHGGQELFSEGGVDAVHLSPCRKRAALCMTLKNFAVEVSQEGRELQRTEHSSICFGARCVPNGLMSWDIHGDVTVKEEGKEEQRLKFPGDPTKLQFLDGGCRALLLFPTQLWIMDLRTGRKELVLDRRVAGVDSLKDMYSSPCGQSVLVMTEEREHFLLKKLSLRRTSDEIPTLSKDGESQLAQNVADEICEKDEASPRPSTSASIRWGEERRRSSAVAPLRKRARFDDSPPEAAARKSRKL